MKKQLPVTRGQYCGLEDIGLGWQHGETLETFKYQYPYFCISMLGILSFPRQNKSHINRWH